MQAIPSAPGRSGPMTSSDHDSSEPGDTFQWLEAIDGDRALGWVKARNAEAEAELASDPRFAAIEAECRAALDSPDRIPVVELSGEHLYNFWTDAAHARGIWRRTTWASWRAATTRWEVLLDLDELNRHEGSQLVWHGAQILQSGPLAEQRALVALSPGGSDADVTREFDLVTRQFIPANAGGFERPLSKGRLIWLDGNTVLASSSTDGEPTRSGYPRQIRRWQRGSTLGEAPVVFTVAVDDLMASAHRDRLPGAERTWLTRAIDFHSHELFELLADGGLERVDVPPSVTHHVRGAWLVVRPRAAWQPADVSYPAGALLAANYDDWRRGDRRLTVLFDPTPTSALTAVSWTRHHLVINVLEDVSNRLTVLTPPEPASADRHWRSTALTAAPPLSSTHVRPVDPAGLCTGNHGDALWLTTTSFLTPPTLGLVGLAADGSDAAQEVLKQAPALFDATGLVTEQHFSTSPDGTRVPWFLVRSRDRAADGTAPTLLYGYGGFELSLTPTYQPIVGRAWLARGGSYVVANIRGGGEYGPAWHDAGRRAGRLRVYEDFAAVAADLVKRGLTSHRHLGMMGGSNGGLLVGNMLTRYPALFGAAVIQVPLLDMRRYHRLLAGASWVAEYGNPDDPADWAYLREISPYHQVNPDLALPPALILTSTRDDRVHPGHARKFAARLRAAGKTVTSYENTEGGHGGAATSAQAAHMSALAWVFLWRHLG